MAGAKGRGGSRVMQSPDLSTLDLTPRHLQSLSLAGYLTAADVLLTAPSVLSKRLNCTPQEAQAVLLELSESLGRCETVQAILDREDREGVGEGWITTGDEGLDALFGKTIRSGSVVEIAGSSGTGKSHFCLHLALTVQLSESLGGLSGGTIYVSSEGSLPSPRLVTLADHLITRLPPPTSSGDPLPTWQTFLDQIHTVKAADVETLLQLLQYLVPAQIEQLASQSEYYLPVRLLVIDSIAAPFRGADHASSSSTSFFARSKEFALVGDALKRLAHIYNLCVVVVNQVSDVFDRPPFLISSSAPTNRNTIPPPNPNPPHPSPSPSPPTIIPAHERNSLPILLYSRFQTPHFDGSLSTPLADRKAAALGHSWSNVLTSRIMLSREEDRGLRDDEGGTMRRRRAEVVFGPWAPRGGVAYVLEEDGLRGIGELELR